MSKIHRTARPLPKPETEMTHEERIEHYLKGILNEQRQTNELLLALVQMEVEDREDDGGEPLFYMDGTPIE